jgi:di/tricarboxylate transporter
MGWEAWLTLGVVVVLTIGLIRNWAGADTLMVGGLTILILAAELIPGAKLPNAAQAVAGLGNPGLITVGVLYAVVVGLTATGAMALITQPLLGRPKTVMGAQTRMMGPVMVLSAFLNNTPVVAMFMPVIDDICKKTQISPSKLFIPLAYSATFGGVCTLIGTSTNLVVHGLLIDATGQGLSMFDITWVGIPCAIAGFVYILVASPWLLPDRKPAISLSDDPRQYSVEMIVQPGGPLVNRTIEDAGLRQLPGLYLMEIDRDGQIMPAVGSTERLQGDDRLIFVGVVESVVDLQKVRGLAPATNQTFKLDAPRLERRLVEAVVSDRCPLVGKSIREGQFRKVYNAAVIAVARSGRRVTSKVGDIVLQTGDTLLLEAHQEFAKQQRNSRDFFLVSGIENSAPPRHHLAWVALAILVFMVVVVAGEWLDMLPAAMLAAGLMLITRCCTGAEARNSVDWSVLVVIAASLGIGKAIEDSQLASTIAEEMIGFVSGMGFAGPMRAWLVLFAVYLVTTLFTEAITNNAAAVLVFPVALAAAENLGVSYMPFLIAIMVAASAGFSTPIGYQTNLMVYGPGGYRFSDYVRFGVPLNLTFMAVTVGVTPFVWPF